MSEFYFLFMLVFKITLVLFAAATAAVIWRGDPHARLMKRRRHYLKKVP